MFRLSKSWKGKPERNSVDICEPSRPQTIDGLRRRASTKLRSVSVPEVVTRISKPSVNRLEIIQQIPEETPHSDRTVPRITKTPWEFDGSRRHSIRRRSEDQNQDQLPAYFFKNLPREVYDCIITQLEQIHLDQDRACASCYLQDIHSLSLTSRAWDKSASAVLYSKVLVVANEEDGTLPRLKIKGTSRLKLLRRTLRENSVLARRVRELQLTGFQTLFENAVIERGEIVNLVASLVMACPRLERLVGFHVPISNAFDRLSHALSTRTNLRERAWVLGDADSEFNEEEEDVLRGHYIAECDPTERFLALNSNHPMLSTLVLHQGSDHPSAHLNFRAIVGTFRSFPYIRHLSICGLPANSFTNLALNAIPSNLQSLRLEYLSGITEKGILRFATSPKTASIQKLALIDLEIYSVLTLAEILSARSANLEEFSLVQERAPTLPGRHVIPTFSSPSLRYLHWEIRSEASPLPAFTSPSSVDYPESPTFPFTNLEPICCIGTSILAASIKSNALPSLRRIRIPHDPQGVIQSLCKPLATALLPSDTTKIATAPRVSTSTGFSIMLDEPVPLSPLSPRSPRSPGFPRSPRSPRSPRFKPVATYTVVSAARVDSVVDSSPAFPPPPTHVALTPMRSRLAAESRILAARKEDGMAIRVLDPEGKISMNKPTGAYVGDIGSKITYHLEPDRGVIGLTGWIAGMDDLIWLPDDEDGDALECTWGSCGHVVDAGVGRSTVKVQDIF